MYRTPCLRSAEVVITTSAPARRYFKTCSELSTPVLAASEAPIRPDRTAIHKSGSRISLRSLSCRSLRSCSCDRSISGW